MLSCVDPSTPQTIAVVHVRRTSIREQGILNYLDDCLILAQSQDQGLGALAPQPVGPSGQLGKEQTPLGMELDSIEQTTRLTQERAQLVLNCPNMFKSRTAVQLKQIQRLLGHMAAVAASYETASTRFKVLLRFKLILFVTYSIIQDIISSEM